MCAPPASAPSPCRRAADAATCMQLQRRLQANLEAHKGYMKDQIEVHKSGESGRRHFTVGMHMRSEMSQSSHKTVPVRAGTRAASMLPGGAERSRDEAAWAELPRDATPPATHGDLSSRRGCASPRGAAAEPPANLDAAAAPAHVYARAPQPLPAVEECDSLDPLMSMHDFVGPDEPGGDLAQEFPGIHIGLGDWGPEVGGISDLDYGDIFSLRDGNPNLLEPSLPDHEPPS
jgi:hypothetical protein